jgi:hypothetical protein
VEPAAAADANHPAVTHRDLSANANRRYARPSASWRSSTEARRSG